MRTLTFIATFGCTLLGSAFADDPSLNPKRSDRDIVYEEIKRTLPIDTQRAKSARLQLDYWYQNNSTFLTPPIRKSVKTKDGKPAEVLLLEAPSMSMPGEDFSMAFLLLDKRVVDWASCWTYNRFAEQELQLEDVDGDGVVDLAFRARRGGFGLVDKRQHTRPGDKRTWLYAYAITSKGFQSLFPDTDRIFRRKLTYDTGGHPVKLELKGLPEILREYQMYECTISATNTSKEELVVPGEWFHLEIDKAGSLRLYDRLGGPNALKPGETISSTVRLVLEEPARPEVTFLLEFWGRISDK
jgi:hypothetical protein